MRERERARAREGERERERERAKERKNDPARGGKPKEIIRFQEKKLKNVRAKSEKGKKRIRPSKGKWLSQKGGEKQT